MVSNESFASNGNGVNGAVAQRYPPGIHVPSLTFFKDTSKQEIDWEVQERHLEFLVGSGVHGGECFQYQFNFGSIEFREILLRLKED